MSSELLALLKQRALKRGLKQKLASGLESDVYVNCKEVSLHGPSLWKLSEVIAKRLYETDKNLTHVAGVSVGGDPIVAGVIAYAHHSLHWDIQALLVRKKAKDHGASQGRATEGQLANMNQKVWLVEDVVSTGGSAIVALEHLRAEGYPLGGFLCLVDREMGGVEALKAQFDIPVITLTKLSELF